MNAALAAPSIGMTRLTRGDAVLWGTAAAAIVVAHIALVYAAETMRQAEDAGGPPPALMIELSPIAFSPPVEQEASIPDIVEAERIDPVDDAETASEVEPRRVAELAPEDVVEEEAAPVAREAPVAEAEKPVVTNRLEPETDQEPLEEIVPDTVEAVTPEVAAPLPQPRPVVEAAREPRRETADRPVEKTRKQAKREKKAAPASRAATMARVEAEPAPRAAAQRSVESVARPRISPARWQAKLQSWLNRHKRYPAAARSRREEGRVQVSFTIDPNGRVTSSRVSRSSGNPALDAAALDMVRRASPVPPPPKEIAQAHMKVAVPVDFNLR